MRPDRYEDIDKAALYEAMGDAYLRAMLPTAHEMIVDRSGVRAHMRDLHAGRRPPETAADHAALSLLTGPRDNGDPVTPEDREAMDACPACGGAKGWMERVTEGGAEVAGMEWWMTCPPSPDGCNGTGKRVRR